MDERQGDFLEEWDVFQGEYVYQRMSEQTILDLIGEIKEEDYEDSELAIEMLTKALEDGGFGTMDLEEVSKLAL